MTLPQSGAIVEEPLLAGKPVAVMGAAWVQVGVSLSHLVCFKYEVDQQTYYPGGNASEKSDEKGNLIDSRVKESFQEI